MSTTIVRAPHDGQARGLLRIRLLGDVDATLDGQAVPPLVTPRMQRLLGRMSLAHGVGVTRQQLAAELWPDSSAAQGRTNLRKLLHDLRCAVPLELVDADHHSVRWCAEPAAWVDVAAFTEAVARGDLEEAVRSYGGDLLPGADDDWVVEERERLRRLAVEALTVLAATGEALSRDDDVVAHSRHLLRLDPLHEPAGRLLMRALARRGERSEALRIYARLAAGLQRDLGLVPEPATRALAEELRAVGRVLPRP